MPSQVDPIIVEKEKLNYEIARMKGAQDIIKDLTTKLDEIPTDLLYSIRKMLYAQLYDKKMVDEDVMYTMFVGTDIYKEMMEDFLSSRTHRDFQFAHTHNGKDTTRYWHYPRKISAIKAMRNYFHNNRIECGLAQAKNLVESMTENIAK